MRARWLASSTRSKRFSTLSMQSSTVTRAIGSSLLEWNFVVNSTAKYPLPAQNSSIFVLVYPQASVTRNMDRKQADRSGFLGNGVIARVPTELTEGALC